jgi:hypothetical protein
MEKGSEGLTCGCILQDGLDIWYELVAWFDKYIRLYYDDNVDGKRVGAHMSCLPAPLPHFSCAKNPLALLLGLTSTLYFIAMTTWMASGWAICLATSVPTSFVPQIHFLCSWVFTSFLCFVH